MAKETQKDKIERLERELEQVTKRIRSSDLKENWNK